MNSQPKNSEAPAERRRRAVPEPRELDDRKPPATHGRDARASRALERREFQDQKQLRPMMAELYHRAEVILRTPRKSQGPKSSTPETEPDPQRLLHELEVHQIELELQNTELRQTRDELEAALENYTDLYDFAPAGYFTLAPDGTIRQVNLTGAQQVGIERSRLLGRSFGQLLLAAQRPFFNAFLNQVFAGEEPPAIDMELPVKSRPLQVVRARAKRSPAGLDGRIVLVDITALKRGEDKVRVSEIRYRRLFETAHDGLLLLDPATRKITNANPFMTKLLGYAQAQLVGKELFEIGLLKDEAASQEMFQKLKRKREVRYEDLPLAAKDGRHQEVEVVANLYSENGHAVIQCNIRDITERKQVEIALMRLAAIVESSDDAIIGMDLNGIITNWNRGAEKIFAYSAREMVGASITRLIPPDRPEEEQHILKKLKRGESVEHFETRRKTKDGRLINVSVTASPIQDVTGKVIGASKVARDITEQIQAEEARRRLEVMAASNRKLEAEILRRQAVEADLKQTEQQQTRLLEQSRSMQEQLRHLSRQVLQAQEDERKRISRELHDVIAQTLTGINVRLATLKQGAGRKDFDRDIELTQKLVEDSVNIVHEFARELRPAALDDLGLIPALHSFMKNFTAQTGVHTHLTAFAGLEQLDTARRTILYRVAQEALTNVSRHAQASRVEVTIQKRPTGICMDIKDNGKSFSVERVLQAQGRKRLGLLGMRERLEMVGGQFEIASAPGQGTTVTAEIPFGKEV